MYNSANYEKTVPGAVRHVVPGATHGYDKVSWQKELLEYTRKYVNDIMGDHAERIKQDMMENIREIEDKFPLIKDMEQAKEVIWINPGLLDMKDAMKGQTLSMADIDDAERRWERFAPFIKKTFPETEVSGGLIESPLKEIPQMKLRLNEKWKAELSGRLLLKMDSDLAVAGSVKARGGIYEILKHSENLALSKGMLKEGESYEKFALPEFKEFFSRHSIHVGSTGNLGLSIGIISAALGYNVTVHMSMDAKQWKKDPSAPERC